jgi:hypothetical protein
MRPEFVVRHLHKVLPRRADQPGQCFCVEIVVDRIEDMRRCHQNQPIEASAGAGGVDLLRDELGEFLLLQGVRIMLGSDRVMRRGTGMECRTRTICPQVRRALVGCCRIKCALTVQGIVGGGANEAGMRAVSDHDPNPSGVLMGLH